MEYIPYAVDFGKDAVSVQWTGTKGLNLSKPFFRQTIDDLHAHSALRRKQSTLEYLEQIALVHRPHGLIFHVSRCGSTVLSNILQSLERCVVLSEPQPLTAMTLPYKESLWHISSDHWERKRIPYCQAMFNALVGGFAASGADRFYIKFASWSLLMLDEILKVWPGVPWLLIFRDPLEVMVSNLRDKAGWVGLRNNPEIAEMVTGIDRQEIMSISIAEFSSRILGQFFERGLHNLRQSNGMPFPYTRLSVRNIMHVLSFLGVPENRINAEAIRNGLTYYSKDPTGQQKFVSDSGRKHREASDEIIFYTQRFAVPAYEELVKVSEQLVKFY
jgi:hypothetical protein